MQAATALIAVTPTDVITAEVTTRPGAATPGGSPNVNKALPWNLFILECELSNHPNKSFCQA